MLRDTIQFCLRARMELESSLTTCLARAILAIVDFDYLVCRVDKIDIVLKEPLPALEHIMPIEEG